MRHGRAAGIIVLLLMASVAPAASQPCTCAPGEISQVAGACVWGTVSTQKPWAAPRGVQLARRPVADVLVTIAGPMTRTTTTGPDGRYGFDRLPLGEYTLDATLPDGRPVGEKRLRSVTIEAPNTCAVRDLLAPSATSIVGIVMYEDGMAAAGVPVELVAADASPTDQFFGVGGKTDEQGEYTLSYVPPGQYLVGVGPSSGPSLNEPFALAYGRTDRGDVVLTVSDEDEAVFVTPIVTRRLPPARIEGAVQWSDGTPALGLVVTAAALGERGPVRGLVRTQSAADGGFTLDVFADTQYRVNISRGERIVYSMDITPTGELLLVTLPVR